VAGWPLSVFEARIYNVDYQQVDPDYLEVRPLGNAKLVDDTFGRSKQQLSHLDYGGGNGVLSRRLGELGWQSTSFDPFVDRVTSLESLGRFDLVTAFEVFEHVPDPHHLMATLDGLIKPDGLLLFSTLCSDGQIQTGQRLTWWYAAPRNGHISLFSQRSLALLAESRQFGLASFSAGLHVMVKAIPTWARHVFGNPTPAPPG
jgi:SAM-dependent methyltransferase